MGIARHRRVSLRERVQAMGVLRGGLTALAAMMVVGAVGYGSIQGSRSTGAGAGTGASTLSAATVTAYPRGIDVSSYQESYGISWPKIYAGGYRFAIIKSSEGNYYLNPYYAKDIKAATAAGLYVSAYHFANPHASGGAAQAQYAYTKAGNYKVGSKHLPFVLDIEYDPYSSNKCYGLSHAQTVAWISAFLSEAKTLTGATPIINTYSDWWDLCTGSSTAFAGYPMWINSYHAGGPASLPAGWSTWAIWQYGQSAKVSGITGTVDLDYFGSSPASETTTTGHAVSIQLHTITSMAGWVVRYTATGLPAGVTMTSTGRISGTPTTAGSYTVTVTTAARTAVVPATISFTWTVTATALREALPRPRASTSRSFGASGTFPTGVTRLSCSLDDLSHLAAADVEFAGYGSLAAFSVVPCWYCLLQRERRQCR